MYLLYMSDLFRIIYQRERIFCDMTKHVHTHTALTCEVGRPDT